VIKILADHKLPMLLYALCTCYCTCYLLFSQICGIFSNCALLLYAMYVYSHVIAGQGRRKHQKVGGGGGFRGAIFERKGHLKKFGCEML
jgi:hypothetical protein